MVVFIRILNDGVLKIEERIRGSIQFPEHLVDALAALQPPLQSLEIDAAPPPVETDPPRGVWP